MNQVSYKNLVAWRRDRAIWSCVQYPNSQWDVHANPKSRCACAYKEEDAHVHPKKMMRMRTQENGCACTSHFVLRKRIPFCSAQAHLFFLCAGAYLFLVAGDFVLRSGFAKFTGRRTQDSGQQCLVERPGLGATYVYNKSKREMGDQISSKAFQICCT